MANTQPTMAQIANAAQTAAKASGLNPQVPASVNAQQLYTINAKKPARCGTGTQGNAAHWGGIVQVLQANGGKATAQQLLQGSIAGNPHNVGNAWPFLRYAINSLNYLVPCK